MSLLKECEDLLKQAWREVKCTSTKGTNDKEILLKALLAEISNKVVSPDHESFIALQKLLTKVILPYNNYMVGWISCKQMYESMLMLLNSNYKRYNLLDLGDAKSYFVKSIPLYCRLSGEKPPALNEDKYRDWDKRDRYGLQSGLILDRLKKDIPNIAILTDKAYYRKSLEQVQSMVVIAKTQKHSVQLAPSSISSSGIVIGDTDYRLTVQNIKTGKELKVNTYSDIKRALNR